MKKRFTMLCMTAALFICIFAGCSSSTEGEDDGDNMLTQTVYVGTYTSQASQGIQIYDLDVASGKLTFTKQVSGLQNPSFLTLDAEQQFVYAVQEISNYQGGYQGIVTALQVDAETSDLTLLNNQPSFGASPCHVVVDAANTHVIVSNYSSGTVAIYPILADGRLGEAGNVQQHSGSSVIKGRQDGPHAHSTTISPDGQYAYTADLGIDKIMIYQIANGQLVANDPAFTRMPPGSGPRHFTFHPNGKYAYVINELNSTITLMDYNSSTGSLVVRKTISTLPQDFHGSNSCADIHVSADGKFLYGSNRGHNSIAIFSVNPESGELTLVGHQSTEGRTPRNFGIDPTGQLLLVANQDSNNIVVFKIDQTTGQLSKMSETQVSMPVCVKFLQR